MLSIPILSCSIYLLKNMYYNSDYKLKEIILAEDDSTNFT